LLYIPFNYLFVDSSFKQKARLPFEICLSSGIDKKVGINHSSCSNILSIKLFISDHCFI
jgi:hypothetical protein